MTHGRFIGESFPTWSRERLHVYAEWRGPVDDLNDPERIAETVDHQRVRYGDVPNVSITWEYGTEREIRSGNCSGGAGIDAEVVATMREPMRSRARRIVELADRWHLNTMTAGCAHQGDAWTCTRGRMVDAVGVVAPGCGTVNGWAAVHERHGEHPYPHRGDACTSCGRNRWDEPTDWCRVPAALEIHGPQGFRFGTSWLVEAPPVEIIAELYALLRPGDPAGAALEVPA